MSPILETIDWQGITLSVRSESNWLGMGVWHLEVIALSPHRAPLPISETGYRSRYINDDLSAFGGVVAFVRLWLDDAAAQDGRDWRASQQLSLF